MRKLEKLERAIVKAAKEVGFEPRGGYLLDGYQIFEIKDVANGLLLYVAQAFLLAGSIFGLDYYVRQINIKLTETFGNGNTKRNKKQQSA